MTKIAIVTGSNKGIGFSIVKGLCQRFEGIVYLTARDEKRGKEAVAELERLGFKSEFHQLDVSDRTSVERFRDCIKSRHGGVDILINNAAISCNSSTPSSYEVCQQVIDINFRGVVIMQDLIYPLVRSGGRILNISSDCGHLSNIRNKYWIERLSKKDLTLQDVNEFVDWFLESKRNGTFNPEDIADGATVAEYRVSKVALSALTIIQQRELEARNISVNSMHPGLVRTDMTSRTGFYSPDQAAETPLHLVLKAPASLRGAYVWYDGKVLDWYDYTADYYFKYSTLCC